MGLANWGVIAMDRSTMLWGLILAPIFYYVALIGGALLWPGYSHVTQYASELGSAASPHPMFFNGNVILCGLSALIGGFGLTNVLTQLSGSRGWAMAAGVSITLWGLAIVIAGLYPMPDDRHGAYGLAIVGQFTPLFAWLALRKVQGLGGLKIFLIVIFVASFALFAIMMGVGGLVTRANVGIWQRINTAIGIPYLAVLGWVLLQRVTRRALA
jgi:glucan biosynthesis protein C